MFLPTLSTIHVCVMCGMRSCVCSSVHACVHCQIMNVDLICHCHIRNVCFSRDSFNKEVISDIN